MKNTNWIVWLDNWLTRNPIKQAPHHVHSSYTNEVMSKIREVELKASAPKPVLRVPGLFFSLEPRFSLAFGVVLASVFVSFMLVSKESANLYVKIDKDLNELLKTDDTFAVSILDDTLPATAEELEYDFKESDALVLAEAEKEVLESEVKQFLNSLDDSGELLEEDIIYEDAQGIIEDLMRIEELESGLS